MSNEDKSASVPKGDPPPEKRDNGAKPVNDTPKPTTTPPPQNK